MRVGSFFWSGRAGQGAVRGTVLHAAGAAGAAGSGARGDRRGASLALVEVARSHLRGERGGLLAPALYRQQRPEATPRERCRCDIRFLQLVEGERDSSTILSAFAPKRQGHGQGARRTPSVHRPRSNERGAGKHET